MCAFQISAIRDGGSPIAIIFIKLPKNKYRNQFFALGAAPLNKLGPNHCACFEAQDTHTQWFAVK
jgi:hypothetical protein